MKYAQIDYQPDGTPVASQFDDVYFSQGEGVLETQHVFIEPNQLPKRFKALSSDQHFTIAETGFGSGLNFLVAAKTFCDCAPKGARLTFVSCEKYPLHPDDLTKIHHQWPEFKDHSKTLLEQYPPPIFGFHVLEFGNIELILMLGDAFDCFSQLTATVDAWFLDGFSPRKNPDIWSPPLFSQIKRLSTLGTTLATFTSARPVRDGLMGAGFSVTKLSGFQLKREMVVAKFTGFIGPSYPTGWPSSELAIPKAPEGKRIAIIGAGISGATTAYELAKRGFNVTVFEQHATPAEGASGNPQGAIYAKLAADQNPSSRFYLQALMLAQHRLKHCADNVEHGQTGLVQLAHNPRELKRLKALSQSDWLPSEVAHWQDAHALSKKLGVETQHPGLWFPKGGWVNPAQWVSNLLNHSAMTLNTQQIIQSVEQTESGWQLEDQNADQYVFDQVVLTGGNFTSHIAQARYLPLKPIAGQVTLIQNEVARTLNAVICTDRYIMPATQKGNLIGSSFRVNDSNCLVTDEDNETNISALFEHLPSLKHATTKTLSARTSVRCTSPDYLPLVGALCDPDGFTTQFKDPLHRQLTAKEKPANLLRGLWVNTGLGSKGLCSSHLCAKLLAAMMNNEALPVPTDLVSRLNPNRFLVRELIRSARARS